MPGKVEALKGKAPAAEQAAAKAAKAAGAAAAPVKPAPAAATPAPVQNSPNGILSVDLPFVRTTKANTRLYEAKLPNGIVAIVYTPEGASPRQAITVAIQTAGIV